MKILFITPFNIFPPYWGGGQRTYHLVKNLARKNKVYLLFPSYPQFRERSSEPYQEEFKKLGVKIYPIGNWLKWQIIEFLNPVFMFRAIYLALSKRIDLIICDYPWSGAYALLVHFFTFKPMVFSEHNLEYEIKEQTKSRYVRIMKLLEIILSKISKRVVVVSRKNEETLARLGINRKKILVFENGFDSERFYPSKKLGIRARKKLGLKNEPIVFFCGKFDYGPNIEALYNIRWKILPKVIEKFKNVKFVIVGGGRRKIDSQLNHPSIVFAGLVDRIEEFLNAADVVIVPITKGSGTRVKILEAVACGKIVVSTSKGAEGLMNTLTKKYLKIADSWNEFAELIVETISKREMRKVSEEFTKKYSWKNIFENFEKNLKKIM